MVLTAAPGKLVVQLPAASNHLNCHRFVTLSGLSNLRQAVGPKQQFRNTHTKLSKPFKCGSKRGLKPISASYYQPFPFDMEHYHKVTLQVIQGQEQMMTGFMLFQKDSGTGEVLEPDRGLVVAIGGDTFAAIVNLLQGRSEVRPLTVDLLWRVLERGMDVSKREWTVIRVAVTGLSESTFLGRTFFGDPSTGIVHWDVDCRPSDATWLAIKCGAPIYIHTDVWDMVSAPLDELRATAQSQMAKVVNDLKAHQQGHGEAVEVESRSGQVDVSSVMMTVRRTDPEPLKLLKMELKVALQEEDYATAARIRDHSFLRLHLAAAMAREEGDMEAAAKYEQRLRRDIERVEREGNTHER